MTRHSKNNTALGYFTHAEKGKLVGIYGKKTQRIGKDSLKPFDSCYLCLLTARNPVICHKGHLYCKECIIQNIINQKEKIKHQKPVKVTKEDEKEKEMLKLFLDQDQIIKQKQVKKEENAAFWIPQKQPSEEVVEKSTDLKVVCTVGNHSLSAKKLINIKFMVEEDCKKCPVCKVDLNSNAKILVMKPCGHAVCKKCIDKVSLNLCLVCDQSVKEKIDLKLEGTGFSARGQAEATKETLAFI